MWTAVESTGLSSSWLDAAYLVVDYYPGDEINSLKKSLAIEIDGTIYKYNGSSPSDYKSLIYSASPGRWLHAYPLASNYEIISL